MIQGIAVLSGMGNGDALASGQESANFGSMSHVSQSKWDAAFGSAKPKRVSKKARRAKLLQGFIQPFLGTELSQAEGDQIIEFILTRIRKP